MASKTSSCLLPLLGMLLVVVVIVVEAENLIPDNYQTLLGHQVWEVHDPAGAAVPVVSGLERDGLADVLGHADAMLRFRVFPDSLVTASEALLAAGVSYRVAIQDLGRHFVESERQGKRDSFSRAVRAESCTSDSCPRPLTEDYMTFEQMEWYLKELAANYPRVELESIGTSYEGRDIWRVHIQAATEGDGEAKSLWLEGGIHAREWISPAVTLGLIQTIATRDSFLPPGVDVYAVPMANPDGYKYSWTSNRLWRKNRSPTSISNCPGVDLNRNWDFQYGVGASDNACSNVYKGTNAFSELETMALKDEMTAVDENSDLRLVMAIHSYGQVLLYPYGYTSDPAPNTDKMIAAGRAFARAARRVNNRRYGVINSSRFGIASGATDDWSKGVLETPYAYTLELPDQGFYGFELPASLIQGTVAEIRKGFKRIARKIFRN